MSDLTTALVTVVLAIIGLASLAVIVSPQARTGDVIKAGGGALSQNILAAVSPVTGGGFGLGSFGSGIY